MSSEMNISPKKMVLCMLVAIASADTYAANADSLAAPAARVDAIFSEYAKPNHPGCALGVYQSGRPVYEKGYGLASLEHGVAIDARNTVFDIGSTSKQFTAASVLLLAQDGKLALDDDIRKFLPELPDYGKPITVAHLIHHTSGLRDYPILMSLAGWDDADFTNAKDALAMIVRQKAVNFSPGSEFAYSNSGYFLMSQIVERVSGKTLDEFARTRIFMPLGMKDTFYLDDHHKIVARRATGYSANSEGGFVLQMSDWMQTGDGAVQSTVADLAKWQQNFDAPKVGGLDFIQRMEMRGTLDDGSPLGYASGLFVGERRGLRTIGHDGAWAGYRASLQRFPDQKFSVAVLCNLADTDAGALAMQVADVYLESTLSPVADQPKQLPTTANGNVAGTPSPKTSDTLLNNIAGTYWDRKGGLIRRIEQRDGKFWYVRDAQSRFELVPMRQGRFRLSGISVSTELQMIASAGGVQKFQLLNGTDNPIYERVDEFKPKADTLNEFVGTYQSAELDRRWSVAIKNGALVVIPPRGAEMSLEPVFSDAFTADGMLLRFQRDVSGRIASFSVDLGRVRNLSFEREDG
jgi:CubicO group peptidase (beta-lactamase class C family)